MKIRVYGEAFPGAVREFSGLEVNVFIDAQNGALIIKTYGDDGLPVDNLALAPGKWEFFETLEHATIEETVRAEIVRQDCQKRYDTLRKNAGLGSPLESFGIEAL